MARLRFMPRARGFSLMEVMVAVIIICVGLLGIAKMQSLALSNTSTSRQRAVAAFEAAGMASAIHANRDYWSNVPANFALSMSSATSPATVTATDATLQGDIVTDITPPIPSPCIATAPGAALCTPAEKLAAFDVARWWNTSLIQLLPNPSASIQCPQLAGVNAPLSCKITISWSEKAVSMNAQEATAEAASEAANAQGQYEIPTYTLYVQP